MGIENEHLTGYHVAVDWEDSVRRFTPPTAPQWQIDVFQQWLEYSGNVLDVEDPS